MLSSKCTKYSLSGSAFAVIALFSCGNHENNRVPPAVAGDATNRTEPSNDTRVEFEGVSFSYDNNSLRTSVTAERTETAAMVRKEDKPDHVFPSHVIFTFKGEYGEASEGAFFSPKVHIYPIAEYRKQFAVSRSSTAEFDRKIQSLRRTIDNRLAKPDEIPFINFIDAEQAFVSKVHYVEGSFGKGVWFLTQYNYEPTLVNNKGLTYIFQGLSTDSKYYLLATFPVSIGFLPSSNETREVEGYSLPSLFVSDDEKDTIENQKDFEAYLSNVRSRLEMANHDEFKPDLKSFWSIPSSLRLSPGN